MRPLLAALLLSASVAACAPVIEGGAPMDLPPGVMETARVNTVYMSTGWIESEEDFSGTFTDEVLQELSQCAWGTYPLDARIHVEDLQRAGRLEMLVNGHGQHTLTGTVEFTDPARDNTVVGRYPIRVAVDAGDRLTGLLADRQMVVSEAFGRALCDAAFGRNPRRPGPWNATGG
ncbi:hypothetical protein GVN24_30360 [Rhizobium sp. CRIBSB]|nr:hypothetical protein [Rhizobium sp. CRIBSB]